MRTSSETSLRFKEIKEKNVNIFIILNGLLRYGTDLTTYSYHRYFFTMATEMSNWYRYPAGSVINWPPGSGSLIQDYGSADPDPKEIFTNLPTYLGLLSEWIRTRNSGLRVRGPGSERNIY
jgi:hypothetical protein